MLKSNRIKKAFIAAAVVVCMAAGATGLAAYNVDKITGIAAYRGYSGSFHPLVLLGANRDTINSALITAVTEGHKVTAGNLIDVGADPNWKSGWPLMVAANQGDTATTKLLLDRGADLQVQPKSLFS